MFQTFRSPRTSTSSTASIKWRSQGKKCVHPYYECPLPVVTNYNHCIRHILEDPTAPFRQCTFLINSQSSKCPNAALKSDRRDANAYCSEHARKASQAKIKSMVKLHLMESPESLMLNLGHYVPPSDTNCVDLNRRQKIRLLDPFVDIPAAKVNTKASEILDCASSSDSDAEPTLVCDLVRQTYDDSDEETIPSTEDDPLRHAGLFTAEEIVSLTRDKLIKLQSLYIDEFRRLRYLLKEKRRKYLHALKKEKETLCSISSQNKATAKEKKVYLKLKALNNYHKRNGVEAILYKKSLEKRAASAGGHSQKTPNVPKCNFMEGGVKCGERTLPSSKFCRKHILKDTHQVLFKACNAVEADTACHEPVPVIFDANCIFHMNLPTPVKIEPVKFDENIQLMKEDNTDSQLLGISGEYQEIDPDDDMAGIMREMKDINKKSSSFNDCVNSEASTDTALSTSAQLSDRDDLLST